MGYEQANMAARYEHEIPEGYEAKIEGNKVIIELKESEDEKIRKFLIEKFSKLGEIWPEYSTKTILAWFKKQKPVKNVSRDEYVKRFKTLCEGYEIKLPNREYDIYHLCDDLSKLSIDSGKQKPAEWSLTDATFIEEIDETLFMAETGRNEMVKNQIEKERNWLKSIPERFNLQPRQEWSEEDKKLLDFWLDVIDRNDWRMDENFCKASREFINRLKSLRPQPHWKPSAEQIKAIDDAIETFRDKHLNTKCGSPTYIELCSLRNDLQKLM